MTEQTIIATLATALKTNAVGVSPQGTLVRYVDDASAEAVAKNLLEIAIQVVGRNDGVDFNRTRASFATVSGQSEYVIGKDILTKYTDIQRIGEVWHTDIVGSEIDVMSVRDFNERFGGATSSGRPWACTVYKKDASYTLKLYPSPNGAYTLNTTIKTRIGKLEDIPVEWHPEVVTQGLSLVAAFRSGTLAAALAAKGMNDMLESNVLSWNGDMIKVERPLSAFQNKGDRNDSYNLR